MGLTIINRPSFEFIDKTDNHVIYVSPGIMFLCGPGIKHEPCKRCGYASYNLCDFPVGNGKTCDSLMCDEHANVVAIDTHYCDRHFKEWNDFNESGGVADVLNGIVPFEEKYRGRSKQEYKRHIRKGKPK